MALKKRTNPGFLRVIGMGLDDDGDRDAAAELRRAADELKRYHELKDKLDKALEAWAELDTPRNY